MEKYLTFIDGSQLPVGTMYGIGQNYSKHAREMGSTVSKSEPIIFIKPPASYISSGGVIKLPKFSNLVHHEVELVVVIGKECIDTTVEEASKYIAGYAVGLDLTLRDIQQKAKSEGLPWAVSKGFVTSAPISKIVPVESFDTPNPIFSIELKVNGILKQKATTNEMERSVNQFVSYLSSVFTLQPGDIIFTGTPEGVGPIVSGDKLFAELVGYSTLEVSVV